MAILWAIVPVSYTHLTVDGELGKGVTAKDVALYMMSKMTTSGATGYFVEYAGSALRNLTMEGRLTLCNQMCIRDRYQVDKVELVL